jgi:uncharacterized membrane protein YqjE
VSIAIAAIIIVVLYLVNKHNRWRQAIKTTAALLIPGILGTALQPLHFFRYSVHTLLPA